MAEESIAPIHYSQIQTARRCLRQYRYQYVERLEPKRPTLPLARGIWIHYCMWADHLRRGLEKGSLLEIPEEIEIDGVGPVMVKAYSETLMLSETKDEYELSWRGMLYLLREQAWSRLFPEEQEDYVEHGHNLPEAVEKILRGYFYHYRKSLDAEQPLLIETEWSRTESESGFSYEGRADLILKDAKGRVILRDWKSTKQVPKAAWKLKESQLHLYPWGLALKLQDLGIDKIDKIEFDYLLTKPPTKPKQNQDGSLSKARIDTDALTYLEALKEYGMEITPEHKKKIKDLLEDSSFFIRQEAPRSNKVTNQILREAVQTSYQLQQVHDRPELGEVRTVLKSCEWDCDYPDLCLGELYGNDMSTVRKKNYTVNPTPKGRIDLKEEES